MNADVQLLFSDAQDIDGADATATLSTDWIDLQAAADLAAGNPLEAVITMTEAYNGTSITFQVQACEADGSNGATLAEKNVAAAGLGFTAATPGIAGFGDVVKIRIDPANLVPIADRTCIRLRYFRNGVAATGALTAYLSVDSGSAAGAKAYPAI